MQLPSWEGVTMSNVDTCANTARLHPISINQNMFTDGNELNGHDLLEEMTGL